MTDGIVRPGDRFEATVTSLDELGAGVAVVRSGAERLRVHVPGALPGECVAAQLGHLSAHAHGDEREAWAELISVRIPSPDRVTPHCPAYGACGACALMDLAYPAQLAWKQERVAAALGRQATLAGIAVGSCVPSPSTTGYRNQAKCVYGRAPASGAPVLGGYAPRSHRVVDLGGCRVVEPPLEEARRVLLALLVEHGIEPFDEQRRTGLLRYVVMRANAAGQVLVTLVAVRRGWAEAGAAIARALVAACPAVTGVVLNVNPTAGNRIFGDEEHTLLGEPALVDRLGEVTVRLSSRSFAQANRAVAARIYGDIVAAAPPGVRLAVDAYAGAAPIALSLAAVAAEGVAIEENPAATAAAAAHVASLPGAAGGVRLVTGDAGQGLADIPAADVVVLDPPRKGCGVRVLAAVARLRPARLVYLSCDVTTLARDLAVLVAGGARLLRVTPYDMMPHTPHVETLALLAYARGEATQAAGVEPSAAPASSLRAGRDTR